MSGFKNIGIREYFKRYGYINAVSRGLFTGKGLFVVRDYENRKVLYYKRISKYVENKYSKYANVEPKELVKKNVNVGDSIWVLWKQGIDFMPAIVDRCYKTLCKLYGDKVILLTDENIDKYVEMPSYIIKKYNDGLISNAVYSDLLRLALLDMYGGTWIDATVFLSGEIPQYILESDFFAFRNSLGEIDNPAEVTSWFIHSKPSNLIIKYAKNIYFAYWEREKYLKEYLLIYIVLTIAVNKCQHNKFNVYFPFEISEYSYLLFRSLGEKYEERQFKHILSLTNIHKLTYKISDEAKNEKTSVYNKIINYE